MDSLLLWLATQTPDSITRGGTPNSGDLNTVMIAAVIFLLVKELLTFIGKFLPGITYPMGNGNGRNLAGGQSVEYWQEIIANRTAEAVRAEIAPVLEKIDDIGTGIQQLVRSDEDRRYGRLRTRTDDNDRG